MNYWRNVFFEFFDKNERGFYNLVKQSTTRRAERGKWRRKEMKDRKEPVREEKGHQKREGRVSRGGGGKEGAGIDGKERDGGGKGWASLSEERVFTKGS